MTSPSWHDVVLAFQTQFARLFCAVFTLERNEIVIGDYLGADKALLEIGVDLTGGLAVQSRRCGLSRRGLPLPRR